MRTKEIYRKLLPILLVFCFQISGYSQAPQGFAYQAVIRDGGGSPIANKVVKIRITLQDASQVAYYTETQTPTSNGEGVISINVGAGTQEGNNTFTSIPWKNADVYMKVEIDPNGGVAYSTMGSPTKIQSVPYALFAQSIKEVVSPSTAQTDDPIFEVKNKLGQVIFGVYEGGVRVYVDDTQIVKGAKGGFAVGGLTNQAKGQQEYFRITPDSARIWVKEVPSVKGAKGGFAVGGLTNSGKSTTSTELIDLTPNNYLIGYESGINITSGLYNSFFGYQAGKMTTSGSYNVFSGYQAGQNNDNGSSNVFAGYQSGLSNIGGLYNVFMGYQSGMKNNSAYNVFVGYQSGLNNTDGASNVFIGHESGLYNTLGWSNNFIGEGAGYYNTTGTNGIFIGNDAGYNNTTSSGNTFIGRNSGYRISGASSWGNTYIGHMSGSNFVKGANNLIAGVDAALNKLKGNNNVILGSYAAYNSSDTSVYSGDNNVFIGAGAGYGCSGNANVFIGNDAGYQQNSSNKLFISNSSGSTPLIGGDFYNNMVGINMMPTANAFEVSGNASKTTAGSWLANSDRRIKTDIKDISNAYETLLKLHPVIFKYTDEWIKTHPSIKNHYYYNFIAQEFQQIFPDAVKGSGEYLKGDANEILQIDTYNAQIVAIKAVQELILENKQQQKQIEELKEKNKEIDVLKAEIEAIKALLKK